MKHEHRTFPKDFWQAIDQVLEHYYVDECQDHRSQPSRTHIYHSLRRIRRALMRPPRPVEMQAVLESQRAVAIVWSTADVLGVRPHLTDDQAWDVLIRCERVHDCNYGFTWELIESVADDMYPASATNDEEDAS